MNEASVGLLIGYETEFFIALAIGVAVLLIFGNRLFNQPSYDREEDDPATQLLPKFLATREQYFRAQAVYLVSLGAAYVALSLLGTRILVDQGGMPATPSTMPLLIALAIVGLVPHLPWVRELERALRRLAHERAYIPEGARILADRLATSDFDFSAYGTREVQEDGIFRTVSARDFKRPKGDPMRRWVRLACLVYLLKQIEEEGAGKDFDSGFCRFYHADFAAIRERFRGLEARIGEIKRSGEPDAELRADVNHLLRRIYVLLGSAVRVKYSSEHQIVTALRGVGFRLADPVALPVEWDPLVGTMVTLGLFLFLFVFAARIALGTFGQVLPPYMPATDMDAAKWAVSAILAHGAAVAAALAVRRRALGRRRWSVEGDPQGRVPLARYTGAAALAGMAGYLVLVVWTLIAQPTAPGTSLLNREIYLHALPWALLPATSGWFVVYYVDAPGGGTRRRLLQAGTQAIVTGTLGFFVARIWMQMRGENELILVHDVFATFILLSTATIGAFLGFKLPNAYRKAFARVYPAVGQSPSPPSELTNAASISGQDIPRGLPLQRATMASSQAPPNVREERCIGLVERLAAGELPASNTAPRPLPRECTGGCSCCSKWPRSSRRDAGRARFGTRRYGSATPLTRAQAFLDPGSPES